MKIGHIQMRVAGVALMLVLAGCGSTPSGSPGSSRSKAADSPDALLADAVRLHNGQLDVERSLSLMKLAFDKAPDRPDIAWLYAQLCTQAPGCQLEVAEARLRRLDPDNAAAWLGALARAQRGSDVAAANEILDAMSRSKRFDIYWNSLIARTSAIANTRSKTEPPSPDPISSRLNEVIGWMSAFALPAFRPLGDACAPQRSGNPITAQRCRAVADALLRGDTYIAEGLGLGIRERLATPNSQDATAVAEEIKRSRYQRDTAGQIIVNQEDKEKFSRELIRLMSTLRREQDVYLAVIRWGQQPVEPPG